MMEYSYFPGCTMTTTGREYGKSIGFVNKKIGMEFAEIKDWNCCGATAGHSISAELGDALPARNISLCEQEGRGLDIVVPCAACYSRMKHAVHTARSSEENRVKLEQLIEMPLKGNLDVVSILEAYTAKEAREAIKSAVEKPLNGLKTACYYGCLFARPQEVTGMKDAENPMIMEEIMELTGAEPVDWSFKTECCGGSHHVDLPDNARPLVYRILKNARACGAQAIVTACPLCMMNLDMRQREVNRQWQETFDIPIYFFTELLAVAMGASLKEAGVTTHFHPAKKLVEQALCVKEGQ